VRSNKPRTLVFSSFYDRLNDSDQWQQLLFLASTTPDAHKYLFLPCNSLLLERWRPSRDDCATNTVDNIQLDIEGSRNQRDDGNVLDKGDGRSNEQRIPMEEEMCVSRRDRASDDIVLGIDHNNRSDIARRWMLWLVLPLDDIVDI
jgi:hypothetical protein